MSFSLKASLQYAVIIAVTALLIWFSLRSIPSQPGEDKFQYLLKTWRLADKGWLLLMAAFAVASHVVRAIRWQMLLVPTGNNARLVTSFLSLMVGYLVNLVVPRGGELSRCYNLYKLEHIPVDVSFGTVVVERVIDLLCLLLLIGLAFILESEKLFGFIETLPLALPGADSLSTVLYVAAAALLAGGLFYLLFRKNRRLANVVRKIWQGVRSGMTAVFRLERKGLFMVHTALIWILYFGMSYSVIRAFPATEDLGFSAIISLFGIGSIAMAAPLPGGTGSYHVLVPQGLAFLYGIPLPDAVALTFIFHGWQTLIMIVGGSLSLLLTSLWVKRARR